MHVVIAPSRFKGSLTAVQVAEAIREGTTRSLPEATTRLLPMADGGQGIVDAAAAAGYSIRHARVKGPTGHPVQARYAVRGTRAVIEMAEASGLARLSPGCNAPLEASTYGTGQLVRAALDRGARHIVLGVGGSATTDGGAGMAAALGVRFLDSHRRKLPPGGAALRQLDWVDTSALDPRLKAVSVSVATDVLNPLVGPSGTAAVFGPHKGASLSDIGTLDVALTNLSRVLLRDLGTVVAQASGGGAGGGLAAGAMAFLGARRVPIATAMLSLRGFREEIEGADLVVTGERLLNEQSLLGKAPIQVARVANMAGVPVMAVAERVHLSSRQLAKAGIFQAAVVNVADPEDSDHGRHTESQLANLVAAMIQPQATPPELA